MKTFTLITALAVGSFSLGAQLSADVLEMKNKKVLEGQYQGGTADSVRFKVGDNIQVVPTSDIVALTFTAAAPRPAESQGGAGTGGAAATGASAGAAGSAAAATSGTATAQAAVPAGTSILVVMESGVDSSRDTVGTRFSGKVAEDVIANGQVVIPKGSPIYGKLNQAEEAGRLRGQSVLELVLTDVSVNGKRIPVVTESVGMTGEKEGKKTVRRSGAGAAIGGIAGGGSGAAKGAAIGAATALGKGKSVAVMPGSILEFRLLQPVTVQ